MKKFLVALVALFAVTAVSAQENNVGLRVGSGTDFDLVGKVGLGGNYIEGRLGFGGSHVNITGIYNWEIAEWNWTPSVGKWFFDAGVGVNLGGAKHFMYVGVAGQAKFGIKFNKVPIRLAIDVTPAFGPYFHLPYSEMVEVPNTSGGVDKVKIKYGGGAGFYSHGLLNFGLSATYCF